MGNTIKCRNFQKQLIFYYNYKFKIHFIRIRQKFDFVQSFFCKIQLNTYTLNNTAILNFRQLFSDLLIYSSVCYTYRALLLVPYKAQKNRRKTVVTLKSVTVQAHCSSIGQVGKVIEKAKTIACSMPVKVVKDNKEEDHQ